MSGEHIIQGISHTTGIATEATTAQADTEPITAAEICKGAMVIQAITIHRLLMITPTVPTIKL